MYKRRETRYDGSIALIETRERRKDETMMKLELDWASDSTPADRANEVGFDDDGAMRVEFDDRPGPAGWPTVRVYAWTNDGEQAYVAGMRLDAWLRDVYGCDEDEAQELASLAVVA